MERGYGRRWLRDAGCTGTGIKHWVVPCTLLASVMVRWCIGLGSYSGASPDHTNFYMMTSWSRCAQGRGRLPCLKTTRLKGIGWSSRITCQRDSGTRTICNIGIWTTPRGADCISFVALRQNVRFLFVLGGLGILRAASPTHRTT